MLTTYSWLSDRVGEVASLCYLNANHEPDPVKSSNTKSFVLLVSSELRRVPRPTNQALTAATQRTNQNNIHQTIFHRAILSVSCVPWPPGRGTDRPDTVCLGLV